MKMLISFWLLALRTIVFALLDCGILRQTSDAGDVVIIAASLLIGIVATFELVRVVSGSAENLYMCDPFLLILTVLEIFVVIYVAVQRVGEEFRVHNATGVDWELIRKLWDELVNSFKCWGLTRLEEHRVLLQSTNISSCPSAFSYPGAGQKNYTTCVKSVSYYYSEEGILSVLHSTWFSKAATICIGVEAAAMVLACVCTWLTIRTCELLYLRCTRDPLKFDFA